MERLVSRLTVGLAVAGGALVFGLAVLVTASVLMRWLAGRVVPGDFELVQIGISIATFCFLPLSQLRGHNIFVDTFTHRLPGRVRAALDGLFALLYAGIAALLAWQMGVGALETLASGTTTMVLGLPLGAPIGVAAVLCGWLALVALVSAVRIVRSGGS